MILEFIRRGANTSKTSDVLNQELFDLVSVIVSVIFELIWIKLVLELLWSIDDDVIGVSSLLDYVRVTGVGKSESVTFSIGNFVEGIFQL